MKKLRIWATPLTIGSFLIMAVSGVLMFFHLNTGLNKLVHEWAGLVMIGAVVVHVVLNWRPFGTYFKRPVAQGLIGFCAVVLALSFVPVSGGGNSARPVMMAVGQADVETVIALSGLTLEQGLDRLKTVGITDVEGMTMPALTQGDQSVQDKVIQALFDK